MFQKILFIVFLSWTNGAPNAKFPLDDRIVGGIPTKIEEFPYQVSIENARSHMCGGSIISQEFILTAGHCSWGLLPDRLAVRAGTSFVEKGGDLVDVKEIFVHPQYDPNTMDYDVSILLLKEALKLGPSIAPINLISENALLQEDTQCIVTGWGLLSEEGSTPSQLHMVQIPYVTNEKCQLLYYDAIISERMLCAGESSGGKDACQGDSGGPLVANGFLTGIVSWGYGCARPEYPGVYTRVSSLRSFIKKITQL